MNLEGVRFAVGESKPSARGQRLILFVDDM